MAIEIIPQLRDSKDSIGRRQSRFAVNQRVTAPHMAEAFADFKSPDPNLRAFLEGGAESLSRRFCPLAAFGTIYNDLRQETIIGGNTLLPIGNLLRKLSDYHLAEGLVDNDAWKDSDKWEVFDRKGRIRSHAVVSVAKALGIAGEVVESVPYPLIADFLSDGGKVGLSLDNKFVNEITDPHLPKLDPAGHIVAAINVVKVNGDPLRSIVSLADPNMPPLERPVMDLPLERLLMYFPEDPVTKQKTVRGMLFSLYEEDLLPFSDYRPRNVIYPDRVITEMNDWFRQGGVFSAV